jgi:biopolymer transport protein ExbD
MQPDDSDEPDVNLTPLIDVVFLLLIFFMVSTTFEHQSRIQVELPEASAEPTTPEAESLEIIVDAQGRYFIGEEQVVNSQLKTLKGAIANVLGERTDMPVIVRADANSPHQSVVTVLDAASQLGLTRISLATTRSTSE